MKDKNSSSFLLFQHAGLKPCTFIARIYYAFFSLSEKNKSSEFHSRSLFPTSAFSMQSGLVSFAFYAPLSFNFFMRAEFIEAFQKHQKTFSTDLTDEKISLLADYYEIVQANNPILHLVAPCSPEEFAVRHVLESLSLLNYLPEKAKFADVGTGAGLPSIPCLIVRGDLRGILIESKIKKARFLEEVLHKCNLTKRAQIINRQFEEVKAPNVSFVTCRALDKFTQKLPSLLKWSKNSSLLFFGGNSLRDELKKHHVKFQEKLMPMSEQRFLFISQTKRLS